jgi:hypothetical protein
VTENDSVKLEYVLLKERFVFFFVDSNDYFKAEKYLSTLRKRLARKVIIIRNEKNFIKLVLSFFPDTYIHNIILSFNKENKEIIVELSFLTAEEYSIAVGHNGEYLNLINSFFRNQILISENDLKLEIKCKKDFSYTLY